LIGLCLMRPGVGEKSRYHSLYDRGELSTTRKQSRNGLVEIDGTNDSVLRRTPDGLSSGKRLAIIGRRGSVVPPPSWLSVARGRVKFPYPRNPSAIHPRLRRCEDERTLAAGLRGCSCCASQARTDSIL
jgi:hypothetical protein